MLKGILGLAVATAVGAEVVCVTGAGGYVATELVKQLLEKGYSVRGTVRSLVKKEKFEHLPPLDDALPGTLELIEADLLKEGSFDACCYGAKYVFHTASPFYMNAADGQEEMMDPAVLGTQNVIRSAKKGGAKRIVVTSSYAAANSFTPGDKPDNGKLYTEDDWNEFTDEEVWKENSMQMYVASKPMAEREGMKLAKELGIEMLAILPSLVLGPVYGMRRDSTSINAFHGTLEGQAFGFAFPICDNRDVARAHIEAAVNPEASGRYIISGAEGTHPSIVGGYLQKNFPEFEFGSYEHGDSPIVLDNAKGKALLGGSFIPLEDTIADMARTMYSLGFSKPVAKGKSEL